MIRGLLLIVLLDLLHKAFRGQGYASLRWQAWSGPSRTGIPASMAVHIGNPEDWHAMDNSLRGVIANSFERFAEFLNRPRLIVHDPTDILRDQSQSQ